MGAGALGGCDNPGVDPPSRTVNFPIAVVMAPATGSEPSPFLYVANSNFDLRFNAGSVQAYDLGSVNEQLGPQDRDRVLVSADVMATGSSANPEVLIAAHAAGMKISPSGTRLYLAVRSDANLTYVDIDPSSGSLTCGGSNQDKSHRCGSGFRRGDESQASPRRIVVPTDPTGVEVGTLSQFDGVSTDQHWVMMSHRPGRVSLFADVAEAGGAAPLLLHTLGDFPTELVNLAFDSAEGLVWLMSADEARIGRAGIAWDRSDRSRSFAFDAGDLTIGTIDDGQDTRDVAFGQLRDGNRAAFVLARRPEALLVIDLGRGAPGEAFVRDVIEVGTGPSRLAVGSFEIGGEARTLVFASCYDSRDVWVLDPDAGRVVTVIRGMSGPFEMAVDIVRERLYVADFRASVIRVADLRPALDCLERTTVPANDAESSCEPPVLGSIGEPRPVGDLL